jgi:hypothetical protein
MRVLRYNNWHKRFIFECLEKLSNYIWIFARDFSTSLARDVEGVKTWGKMPQTTTYQSYLF